MFRLERIEPRRERCGEWMFLTIAKLPPYMRLLLDTSRTLYFSEFVQNHRACMSRFMITIDSRCVSSSLMRLEYIGETLLKAKRERDTAAAARRRFIAGQIQMGNFSRRKTSEKCFRLSTGSLYRPSYIASVRVCKVIMGNRARICPFDFSPNSQILSYLGSEQATIKMSRRVRKYMLARLQLSVCDIYVRTQIKKFS